MTVVIWSVGKSSWYTIHSKNAEFSFLLLFWKWLMYDLCYFRAGYWRIGTASSLQAGKLESFMWNDRVSQPFFLQYLPKKGIHFTFKDTALIKFLTHCNIKKIREILTKCSGYLMLWLSKERNCCRFNCATFHLSWIGSLRCPFKQLSSKIGRNS